MAAENSQNLHTELARAVHEALKHLKNSESYHSHDEFNIHRTQSVSEAQRESLLPTDTVVKVHGTGVRPSYLQPWQVREQCQWTGTGFVLPDKRIMTNAHVVQDATVLQVQKQDDPEKFRALAVCIAHDLDLAIMTVADDTFWEDLPSTVFADELLELYKEVKVVGFPTGGATICVTKGVLSRIDAQVYVHPRLMGIRSSSYSSPGASIIMQIDAAINAGNSGGPTFDNKGKVVGVASSGMPGQQNVGYIVPSPIAMMFLEEFVKTGRWSGVSELGLVTNTLESESMRRYLKMGKEKGVLVKDVAPLGAVYNEIHKGDVITNIDGNDVTNEGNVALEVGGQKIFIGMTALVTTKPKGQSTSFRILRNGETKEVTLILRPIPPLAPRFHDFDSVPDYVIVGGIVFTRGCVPLMYEYMEARSRKPQYPHVGDSDVWSHFDRYKKEDEDEIVVLLNILKHDVNIGYGRDMIGVIDSLNEQKVTGLSQFAHLARDAIANESEEFIRFRLKRFTERDREEKREPDIVIEREKVVVADKEICTKNRIPDVASPAMLCHFRNTSAAIVCSSALPLQKAPDAG